MKRNPWFMLLVLILIFGALFTFMVSSAVSSLFGSAPTKITSKDSVLHLRLDGVILDGKKFLKPLLKWRDHSSVKAVIVEISSPGGVVGPSQEIYTELKKIREVYKKPIIAVSTSLVASGGYYSALAADKIYVAPGTLIGSIGVIMEFVNLEGVYKWAKINRYSITTGKYKDSGAEYRPMRDDERQHFQELADSVLGQFKKAVVEGRKLKSDDVDRIADGRVFTGEQAIKLGLADGLATVDEAIKIAAKEAGLKEGSYEVFEPPKENQGVLQKLLGSEEEEGYTSAASKLTDKFLKTKLNNQLLFLMPGTWE